MFGGPPPPPSKAELAAQEKAASQGLTAAAVICVLLHICKRLIIAPARAASLIHSQLPSLSSTPSACFKTIDGSYCTLHIQHEEDVNDGNSDVILEPQSLRKSGIGVLSRLHTLYAGCILSSLARRSTFR
ncbi:uncharacterized protein K452DRAFT_103413 [Aplosporella prunicola CBS 121167]|uniref:Uncharacterized protein n=1 Tax=Aplosporella prunicola CBS 121167 TaxID=1176127 RepID=A0A6A6BP60_9PEZI|nr:uncharacterized protein K452DRAFT_103413 [Aplosporella prunicola CBS 121167]KAF2145920.1 hypothetical protein K452DRAFT_103413 [Aplosporella prunicola CBS 121167]